MKDEPEQETKRQNLAINAINPKDGKELAVQIAYERLQALGKINCGYVCETAFIVPKILQKPTAIFEGLCWDEDEDSRGYGWRCYCGIPDRSYDRDGNQRPPYPGQVYVIFINDEKVAYLWHWVECDPKNPELPIGYKERFKERLL
jgi:hypothetical protein